MPEETENRIYDALLPKNGKETSAFMVAIVSALTPVGLLFICIIGLIFITDPKAREVLIYLLVAVVVPGILAGGAVGWKFIGARGAVSVAKVEAIRAITAPPATAAAPTSGATVTTTATITPGENSDEQI